jgi:hypothetical protein
LAGRSNGRWALHGARLLSGARTVLGKIGRSTRYAIADGVTPRVRPETGPSRASRRARDEHRSWRRWPWPRPSRCEIKPFGCQAAVYGYDTSPGDTFLAMTRTVPTIDVLEILLPGLTVRMETSARKAVRGHVGLESGSARQAYFRDYLRGYGDGVAEAIRAVHADLFKIHCPALGKLLSSAATSVDCEFTVRFGAQEPLRSERGGNAVAWQAGAAAGYAVQDQDDDERVEPDDLVPRFLRLALYHGPERLEGVEQWTLPSLRPVRESVK